MSKDRDAFLADLPSVSGWRPPVTYDKSTDSYRVVTQDDVEKWRALEAAYGRMVTFLRTEHQALMNTIKGREAE